MVSLQHTHQSQTDWFTLRHQSASCVCRREEEGRGQEKRDAQIGSRLVVCSGVRGRKTESESENTLFSVD